VAHRLRRGSAKPAPAPMRHGPAAFREHAMAIMRLCLVAIFLLTLPVGVPLLNGAIAFLFVLGAGIAMESFA
jgi:hypothetical protein